MVRKAPATTKHKGSQKNETDIPGLTGAADIIQGLGSEEGKALDDAIARAAKEKTAAEIMEIPIGGLNSDIAAPVNSE